MKPHLQWPPQPVDSFVTLLRDQGDPWGSRLATPRLTPRTPRHVTSSQSRRAATILRDDPLSLLSGAARPGLKLVDELAEISRARLGLTELHELRRTESLVVVPLIRA